MLPLLAAEWKRKELMRMAKCNERVEVFSRVVGYFRPVARWNDGKKEEFAERKTFAQDKALKSDFGKISRK